MARDLLPDDREYHFEEVNIVSPVDEYGEVKMEIVARTDIYDKDGAKKGRERGLAPANRSEYEPRIESYRSKINATLQ